MDERTSQEATPTRAATTASASPAFDPRDLIPTPLFCATPEGRLVWMNAAAESLTGRHAASVAGEPFSVVFPGEWKQRAARTMFRKRRQGVTDFYLEAPIVTGAEARWVGLHVRLATAANGRAAYVCAAHDLHEIHSELDVLKRRTRELSARLEEATAGAELKSNFLAAMSGELRAPMNGVIGMSRLLLDSNLDRDQLTWAEVIQGSGQQLLELVDDILDYSRIESGQLAVGSMDFDLRVTVDAVASLLATRAHEANVRFSSLVHHRVPSLVNGDPGRVRQVLLQLAQCALEDAEGGEVQIRVELVDETAHQAVIRFWVNRVGAPLGGEADVESHLLALYGGDAGPGGRSAGRSLGLVIARRVVTLLGGDSGSTKLDDLGTKLWFRIPLGKQAERPQAAPRTSERADVATLRALVVDGDAAARAQLVGAIASWGASADESADGPAALEMLRAAWSEGRPYGLVLADIEIAGLEAPEFAAAVRADGSLASTPLGLVTAMGRPGDAARAEEWGYAGYFVKPIEATDLRAALAEILGRPADARGLVTRHTVAEMRRRAVRVVVVEDNPIDQLVIASALKRVGYVPEMTADVEAAAAAIARQPADVAFVDVASAGDDGLERARALRAACDAAGGPRTPIVALVGRVREEDRSRCTAAGIDDLLGKPVDLEALVATVGRWAGSGAESSPQANETPAVWETPAPIAAPIEVDSSFVDEAPVAAIAPPAELEVSASFVAPIAADPPSVDVPQVETPAPVPAPDIVESQVAWAEPAAEPVAEPAAEPVADPVALSPWDAGDVVVLDAACLDTASMGNAEIRGLLVDAFLNRSRQPVERLKKAAEWKDAKAVEFQAQALSGMCKSVGASRAQWVLDRIASLASAGALDEIEAGIGALDGELGAVRGMWRAGASEGAAGEQAQAA